MHKSSSVREPLFRIAQRRSMPRLSRWGVRLLGVLAGVLLCSIIILAFTDLDPVTVFSTMFNANFGEPGLKAEYRMKTIWSTIRDTMTLLLVGLALAPAFRMKFWNIGGEGQILVGGLATAAVMKLCGDLLPSPLLFAGMVLASLLAGMIWGVIPAFFKAHWNTNETLFTLMMNYIAMQLVSAFSIIWEAKKGSGSIGVINRATKAGHLPTVLVDTFGKGNYIIHVLIVLTLCVAVYVYMTYTKHGFELSVVGESENTARYAGINMKKVIIRTMMISGALCGLAGFILVSGSSHTISVSTTGGRGFTAIIVAWLGQLNPIFMLLISYFLVFMDYGARGVASACRLNVAFSDIITGVMLFCILGSEFFIRYRVIRRGHHAEAETISRSAGSRKEAA